MTKQVIRGTHIKEIANTRRVNRTFMMQKKEKKTAFYVLPSHMWLQEARRKQPGLLITTFDDVAAYILKQANVSYIPLSEEERTLFFQQFIREEGGGQFQDIQPWKVQGYADTYGQIKRLGLAIDDIPSSLKPLKPLFASYEAKVVYERVLLDPENIILTAIKLLETSPEKVQISLITIDGYYDFSPLQALLIEALKKADIAVEVYIPHHQDVDIVEKTVAELVSMGFKDERGAINQIADVPKMEVIAATTEEEQWRGVIEDICSQQIPLHEIGIIVVDERNGLPSLERYAKDYGLPLNRSKKRKMATTAIHSFLLITLQQSRRKTKWEQLPVVEHILKLFQVSDLAYAKQKQLFIQTGELDKEAYRSVLELSQNVKWKKRERFVRYLEEMQTFLNQLPFLDFFEEQFEHEHGVNTLKEMADEYKALQSIQSQLHQYQQLLLDKGLHDLEMTLDLFEEWIRQLGEGQLFEQRAFKQGVAIHSWRDIALFKGKKLYVIGMNEGKFPTAHQLSGYVNERDLLNSAVRFSSPTHAHFRDKERAHFEQLPYIVDHILFTYVKGVDENHPLLPSTFLEDLPITKKWSWEERMKTSTVYHETSLNERVAFHVGTGFTVEDEPEMVRTLLLRQEKLEKAEELLCSEYSKQLKKPIVAVTALESYARCPFKYAMERVLNVKEPLNEQDRVSPLDIGEMIHSIIEEIYLEFDVVGVPFGQVEGDTLDAIYERAKQLFEEKWQEVEKHSYEISLLDIELTKKEWEKHLRHWWQAERKHFWDNPALAEMKMIALEKQVRFNLALSDQTLTLIGKIDRVDRIDHSFVIYDYKTGKASLKMEDVRSGLKLQLPLYAYAISQEGRKSEGEPLTADGATYISLREPSKRAGNGVWRSEHTGKGSRYQVSSRTTREEAFGTEQFLEKYELKDRIEFLWEGMHKKFPVEPLDCSTYCQFRSVCRVTNEQMEGIKE